MNIQCTTKPVIYKSTIITPSPRYTSPKKNYHNPISQDTCKYWLVKHKRMCKNKLYTSKKCKLHLNKNVFDKPNKCIVCYNKISINDRPFSCGHWVHIDCIYKSCKQECPICRQYIYMNKRELSTLNEYIKIRQYEKNQEEINDNNIIFSDYAYDSDDITLSFIQQLEFSLYNNMLQDTDDGSGDDDDNSGDDDSGGNVGSGGSGGSDGGGIDGGGGDGGGGDGGGGDGGSGDGGGGDGGGGDGGGGDGGSGDGVGSDGGSDYGDNLSTDIDSDHNIIINTQMEGLNIGEYEDLNINTVIRNYIQLIFAML
jgi:hypothetical protein